MSIGPTRGPVQRSSDDRDFSEIFQRLDDLERSPGQGWRFDFDNEGGFGFLRFNDSFDLDTFPDPADSLATGGTWGGAIEEASGDGLLIGSTTTLLLKALGDMGMAVVGTLAIAADGPITIRLGAGQTLTVLDNSNNPLFRVADGSADLHIPTGGNVVADL